MDVKKTSQLQEKKVAKELNARVTPASGALWGSKGDVRSDRFLVECKTTQKSFYSLSSIVWNKIRSEATKDGLRIPVMCIDLSGGKDRVAVFAIYDLFSYDEVPDIIKSIPIHAPIQSEVKRSLRITKDSKTFLFTFSKINIVVIPWEDFLQIVKE